MIATLTNILHLYDTTFCYSKIPFDIIMHIIVCIYGNMRRTIFIF